MPDRDRLYDEAVEVFGAAVERLARSYELDAHKRQDPFEARIAFVVENGESTALILRQGGVEQRARKLR